MRERRVELLHVFPDGRGPSLGFGTAQRYIRAALGRAGVGIGASDRTLAHVGAHLWRPSPGKVNHLWYPFEGSVLHPDLARRLDEADVVIASCEDNRQAFLDAGVRSPVRVCPLGIDADLFWPCDRRVDGKFVFLWVGQADIRKGWDIVARAFAEAFRPEDPVVLYLKTTSDRGPGTVGRFCENVVFDCRILAPVDLADLYRRCHALVFPTRGEGTGLPVLEAMATGMLVLAPPVTGLRGVVTDETALPLCYHEVDAWYGVRQRIPEVDVADLARKMRQAAERYGETSRIREAAARHIRERHDLDALGSRLSAILFDGSDGRR